MHMKHQTVKYKDARVQFDSNIIEGFSNGEPINCQHHQISQKVMNYLVFVIHLFLIKKPF